MVSTKTVQWQNPRILPVDPDKKRVCSAEFPIVHLCCIRTTIAVQKYAEDPKKVILSTPTYVPIGYGSRRLASCAVLFRTDGSCDERLMGALLSPKREVSSDTEDEEEEQNEPGVLQIVEKTEDATDGFFFKK